jgi:hypothetical protein
MSESLRKLIRSIIKESNQAISRKKYPRTFHLPWSESRTEDDKTLSSQQVEKMFAGKQVVVTEKLDGENTTIYSDGYCHARSMDSAHHVSRSYVKSIAAQVSCDIPLGWRLMGENLYAKHSIEYDDLPDYFILFGIADENDNALAWNEVEEYADLLGLTTAPVIYKGVYDEERIKSLRPSSSKFGGEAEGYVIRTESGFPMSSFGRHAAKFVRKGHVQTKDHWMHTKIVPNKLKDR